MITNDFKPCPFCGSNHLTGETAIVPGDVKMQQEENRIICLNCGAQGPNELTRQKALDMWNMRRREFPAPYMTKKI
jgi:Lar family restriction alleviation protein